jgi:hypothetical protein
MKPATEKPLSAFKTKLLRLCALYARGQRAQDRLLSLDVDRISVGRRLDEPPQICRPILVQMAAAAKLDNLDPVVPLQAAPAPIYVGGEENQW